MFGGVELIVDDVPVNLADKVAYKGMMLDGVPNFAFAVGYTNASWTLKIGLVCEHFCRLLALMDANGDVVCRAERDDRAKETRPLLDFQAGYVRRVLDKLPRQGMEAPWLVTMDYELDKKLFAEVESEHLRFTKSAARSAAGRKERAESETSAMTPSFSLDGVSR
jgi:hypothetical protein